MLGNYPHDGLTGVSAQRTHELIEFAKQMGGKLHDVYALLGQHDLALIVELPGNDDALKLTARLKSKFGISSTTFPAISIERFDQIAEALETEIESNRMEARE